VVGELGADGYVSLPDEEVVWKYFADKGSIDEEERRERGKSVEVYGRGRYNPEGLNMRHRCVERDRTGD
jgi:hypothetical protein